MNNFNRPLILASSSPRRHYLMKEIGFTFRVEAPDIDESFPADMDVHLVPTFLAESKAKMFITKIGSEIVVTADTVVILDGNILNKPVDRSDAVSMLTRLSGKTHLVITAVCVLSRDKINSFDNRTEVTFNALSKKEIEHYVDTCKPFDKAGAYGAQECLPMDANPCSVEELEFLKGIDKLDLIANSISRRDTGLGMDGIREIKGSYFNVMGLPLHKVYSHLMRYQDQKK